MPAFSAPGLGLVPPWARAANILVKQHGQDAPIQAAMGADAMLEAGIALLLNDNVGGGKTG